MLRGTSQAVLIFGHNPTWVKHNNTIDKKGKKTDREIEECEEPVTAENAKTVRHDRSDAQSTVAERLNSPCDQSLCLRKGIIEELLSPFY